MNIPPPLLQKRKIGTCPHGLPQGACPICNGMGGGGGESIKKTAKNKNEAIQAQMISQYKMQLSIGSTAHQLTNLVDKLSAFSQKPQTNASFLTNLAVFAAKSTLPVLNSLKNIANFANKTSNVIREKFTDISDKLNAIFGELKNSVEKKISDKLKDFKKKFKSIFGISDPEEVEDLDDEEKKVEESKRMFELKTVLHKIKEKIFYRKSK